MRLQCICNTRRYTDVFEFDNQCLNNPYYRSLKPEKSLQILNVDKRPN